jgi:Uma2 family endonuclease
VPDVSFIRLENIPLDWNIERPFPGAPTLAIEVMSPDDKAVDLQKRIHDYLSAGTEQIWVAYPDTREIHQYIRGEEMIRIYQNDDVMDVESLFPGLTLVTSELFNLPIG